MHVVNLDWLSIYVDASKWRIHSSYGVRKEEYGTSVYKDMYTISRYGGELAVFSCNPRNSTMKSGTGIIKIINSVSYWQKDQIESFPVFLFHFLSFLRL